MHIVFHGDNAGSFSAGFAARVGGDVEITLLPDVLRDDADRARYAAADVLIATRFGADLPRPENLRLLHAPAAGTDAIDVSVLPPAASVCNCFGHEAPIAEFVMASILQHAIPIHAADHDLREGKWTYWGGSLSRVHGDVYGKTVGLLGYGHIGQAVAVRAHAFGMKLTVANRSKVNDPIVDRAFGLDDLTAFWGSADYFVVSLPLLDATRGLVDAAAFAAMPAHSVLVNVGRGAVIDETALYNALHTRQIAGAVIDTWYNYPDPTLSPTLPGSLPFQDLTNLVMTPHMSGWTMGTIERRAATMADNIRRLRAGQPLINVLHAGV